MSSASKPKSREVRAGLVLYGGVSLAIYIHGVTYEFFRAVRGRGIYRLIKALTDSDIVVDVVSGTSAGGINGIMLAYALCNDRDFQSVGDLWREDGDIRKLLRDPAAHGPESLLDSEGFYQARLQRAFERMDKYAREPDEDSSDVKEMDVFITGTDVHGAWATQFDDAGHPIDIKDHRAVFHLKHRAGRKHPFREGTTTHEALAKLSRITSCFPGAFAPVHVRSGPKAEGTADDLLQTWGALRGETYFLDGGVVDNKPFTYTLEAIFSRTADRRVDRKLFYVDPDPECSRQTDRSVCPNVLQTVLASLIGIPGYEGIADDLRLLEHRNRELKQYKRMVNDLDQRWAKVPFTLDQESDGRATPGIESSAQAAELYRRSRLVHLSERVTQGVLRDYLTRDGGGARAREKATQLIQAFDHIAFNADELLRRIDVHFRRRRLYRLVYRIYDLLYGAEGSALTEAGALRYRNAWKAINWQIELIEIVRWALEGLVDDPRMGWRELAIEEVWPRVQCACYFMVDDRARPAQLALTEAPNLEGEALDRWYAKHLSETYDAFKLRQSELLEQIQRKTFDGPAAFATQSFLPQMDRVERAILKRHLEPDEPVCRTYATFAALDELLFPLEMVGGLHEKDQIEAVRISPRDAQRGFSESGYSDKVSGDVLYHFGAFFKRSWRSNDILWGRLDGMCQITESLLTKKRLEEMAASPAWRQTMRDRLYEGDGGPQARRNALDPATLFPNAGFETHRTLRKWLDELASEDQWQGALDRFDDVLTPLIEAAQLEVVQEELPRVAMDAIREQAEWNQYQRGKNGDPRSSMTSTKEASSRRVDPPWIFQPTPGSTDPFVAVMASEERARSFMKTLAVTSEAAMRPRDTVLGKFFRSRYRVGSEELTRDIPTTVLMEILATALLVFRNCILHVLGPQADRIRRNPIYFWCVTVPLQVFYWMAVVFRRSPGGTRSAFLVVLSAWVLAIVYAIFFREVLVWNGAKWNLQGIIWFLAVPTLFAILTITVMSLIARGARKR
jgi:patatin-related protein